MTISHKVHREAPHDVLHGEIKLFELRVLSIGLVLELFIGEHVGDDRCANRLAYELSVPNDGEFLANKLNSILAYPHKIRMRCSSAN